MSIDVYEVVQKLIGSIEPIGDSGIDEIRLKNLKETTALVDALMQDIYNLRAHSGRHEHSIKQACRHASGFLTHIRSEYTT